MVFKWFRTWEYSGYVQLPFAGAWNDQPTWVTDGFETLQRVGYWHEINGKLADVSDLKNMDES